MARRLLLLLLKIRKILVCFGLLMAAAAGWADEPRRHRLEVAVSYGDIDGFAQVPAGGVPGSSSLREPSLETLSGERSEAVQLSLQRRFGPHWLAGFSATRLFLNGAADIDGPLISRDTLFTAGERLRSDSRIDRFELYAGYRWQHQPRSTLIPALGLSQFRFDYDLAGSTARVDRNYSRTALSARLSWEWRLARDLRWQLDAAQTLRLSTNTQRQTRVDLALLWEPRRERGAQPGLSLALTHERFRYRDTQPLPNRLRIERWPFVSAGVSLSW